MGKETKCANDRCEIVFIPTDPRTRYCTVRCARATRKRRHAAKETGRRDELRGEPVTE